MKFKLYFWIILLLPFILLAQNQQGEAVELPDFVIRGSESVKLPLLKKKRPFLISSLSREFFLPIYSADDLSLINFNLPDFLQFKKIKKQKKLFGSLSFSAGYFTLPAGNLNFGFNSRNLDLFLKLWGINVRDYVKYANYNASGLIGNLDFYVNKKSRFLPAMAVKINANANRSKFFLYGSTTPSKIRKTQSLLLGVNLHYSNGSKIIFDFNFSDGLLFLNELDLKEFYPSLKGNILFDFNGFGITEAFTIKHNKVYANSVKSFSENFFDNHIAIKLQPFIPLKVKFGFYFSAQASNYLFEPTADLYYNPAEGVTFRLVYLPHSEFLSFRNLFALNKFISLSSLNGKYIGFNSDLTMSIGYEYRKKFQISGGFQFQSANKYPYFQDVNIRGVFQPLDANNVSKARFFLNLFYYNNNFGNISALFELNDVRNGKDILLPYFPKYTLNANYSRKLFEKFEVEITLQYFSNYFTNLQHTHLIDTYLNIKANLKYSFSRKLKFDLKLNNLLNNNNFYYFGYKEEPFDLLVGVEYNF